MNYNEALKLATVKHKGQYRKNSHKEYITHPIAVADCFEDEDYKIVAILHDTLEDTDLTMCELIRDFGLKFEIANALRVITKEKDQTYLDFILTIKTSRMATAVKIADLKHNLYDLEKGNLREKYLMALYILNKNWRNKSKWHIQLYNAIGGHYQHSKE